MFQLLLSAILVFASTSMDYLLLLMIIFTQTHTRKGVIQVFGGEYLGTAILVILSLVATYLLHYVPDEWMIGLLGLIPIALGLHLAFKGEEEADKAEIQERLEESQGGNLIWTVAFLTIASGGDNVGIYVPYFTSLAGYEFLVVIFIFFLAIALLCYISMKLARLNFIEETVERYERVLVPLIFILLGIYIMYENGTLAYTVKLILN
ncbi:CadD family cadmium resistance transporter [Vaginisenegalia massiliensis]|uniref:CadD family cadmium resistance transporter n=1 Tax=Vaginisenegalia massiliensis TaxID=2058294 RepID=UPI000F531E62|nr:CadD family cadmium resistance transporter [Vaginisenegalia massiliensis]